MLAFKANLKLSASFASTADYIKIHSEAKVKPTR